MHLNHPETIPLPRAMGKLSSTKLAKKGWGPLNYMLFYKRLNYGDNKEISGCQGLEGREG